MFQFYFRLFLSTCSHVCLFDFIQVVTQATVLLSAIVSAVFSAYLSLIRSSFLGAEALRYEHTL